MSEETNNIENAKANKVEYIPEVLKNGDTKNSYSSETVTCCSNPLTSGLNPRK